MAGCPADGYSRQVMRAVLSGSGEGATVAELCDTCESWVNLSVGKLLSLLSGLPECWVGVAVLA